MQAPACGIAPGDSTVPFPMQQLAFEFWGPAPWAPLVLPCREGLTVVQGSRRCPFRLALAKDGRVSVPTRLAAPVLSAGSLPQRLPPAR